MKKIKYYLIPITLMLLFVYSCSTSDNTNKNEKEYWTCTMHPQVHKDGPGVCPICGMELIKKVSVEKTENTENTNKKDMTGMITLTSNEQVLADVSTIKIKTEKLTKELSAYSYLDFEEQNRNSIGYRRFADSICHRRFEGRANEDYGGQG